VNGRLNQSVIVVAHQNFVYDFGLSDKKFQDGGEAKPVFALSSRVNFDNIKPIFIYHSRSGASMRSIILVFATLILIANTSFAKGNQPHYRAMETTPVDELHHCAKRFVGYTYGITKSTGYVNREYLSFVVKDGDAYKLTSLWNSRSNASAVTGTTDVSTFPGQITQISFNYSQLPPDGSSELAKRGRFLFQTRDTKKGEPEQYVDLVMSTNDPKLDKTHREPRLDSVTFRGGALLSANEKRNYTVRTPEARPNQNQDATKKHEYINDVETFLVSVAKKAGDKLRECNNIKGFCEARMQVCQITPDGYARSLLGPCNQPECQTQKNRTCASDADLLRSAFNSLHDCRGDITAETFPALTQELEKSMAEMPPHIRIGPPVPERQQPRKQQANS